MCSSGGTTPHLLLSAGQAAGIDAGAVATSKAAVCLHECGDRLWRQQQQRELQLRPRLHAVGDRAHLCLRTTQRQLLTAVAEAASDGRRVRDKICCGRRLQAGPALKDAGADANPPLTAKFHKHSTCHLCWAVRHQAPRCHPCAADFKSVQLLPFGCVLRHIPARVACQARARHQSCRNQGCCWVQTVDAL